MKLLSFDVGIKNLAYCLFEIDEAKKFKIIDWNVVSLLVETETVKTTCSFITNTPKKQNKKCTKSAVFRYEFSSTEKCYCKTHIPKNLLLPIKNINKIKKEELCEILNLRTGEFSRTELIKKVKTIMLLPVKKPAIKVGSNETCLIDIGRRISTLLPSLFEQHELDYVIIENQISTIATRMKSIQCMLAQFFIIKYPYCNIEFVSSINKLKFHDTIPVDSSPTLMKKGLIYINPDSSTTELQNEIINEEHIPSENKYREHKNDSIKYCKDYLKIDDPQSEKPLTVLFNNSKKKDDLADSFLQGVWYIKNRIS
jgi:hypothetical protein